MREPQTLLMVVQGNDWGKPAASTAWCAGAWPTPAGSTQPRNRLAEVLAVHGRLLHCRRDRGGGELRRSQRLELALEGADRRALGGDDDDRVWCAAHWNFLHLSGRLTWRPCGWHHRCG